MIENKLMLMIEGHEIWLEGSKEDANGSELALMYGHNMRQDGVADATRLNAFAYSPSGVRSSLELNPKEDQYFLRYDAKESGFATIVVDMGSIIFSKTDDGYKIGPRSQFKGVTYAGAFHQMAKSIVPLGDAAEFKGEVVHGILEIVPNQPFCHVNQEISLQVFYEGKQLPDEEVKAVSKKEGNQMALIKTDAQGNVRIPVTTEGEWMFLVRHRDPTKRVSDAFDESVFVTTLVLVAK